MSDIGISVSDGTVMNAIRELGSAAAVLILAIYVIVWQGKIISENTRALTELSTLIRILTGNNKTQGAQNGQANNY